MRHLPRVCAPGRCTALGLSALTLTAAVTVAASPPAHAGAVDVWTHYASMSACKSGRVQVGGVGSVRNDACFGLTRGGGAIGLIDLSLPVDEYDQADCIPYDDEQFLPPPQGAVHEVDEIWNNSSIELLVANSDSSLSAVAAAGKPVYGVAPHADETGPLLDGAPQGYSQQYHYNSYGRGHD